MDDPHIYTQLIINLGAVIGVMLCYFLIMKWFYKKGSRSTKEIRLISTLSLTQKEKLIVVEVEKKRYLIGVTQHNINLISSLAEESVQFDEIFREKVIKNSEKSGEIA